MTDIFKQYLTQICDVEKILVKPDSSFIRIEGTLTSAPEAHWKSIYPSCVKQFHRSMAVGIALKKENELLWFEVFPNRDVQDEIIQLKEGDKIRIDGRLFLAFCRDKDGKEQTKLNITAEQVRKEA